MSSAHIQELRGHYVRRLPTSDEISTRSPIVLTERDRQLLVAVHEHGFLTTDLVELAFFPPSNGSRSSASSKAYERVRDLWLWGYLERVELPVLVSSADVDPSCTRWGSMPYRSWSIAWEPQCCPPASAARSTRSRLRRSRPQSRGPLGEPQGTAAQLPRLQVVMDRRA